MVHEGKLIFRTKRTTISSKLETDIIRFLPTEMDKVEVASKMVQGGRFRFHEWISEQIKEVSFLPLKSFLAMTTMIWTFLFIVHEISMTVWDQFKRDGWFALSLTKIGHFWFANNAIRTTVKQGSYTKKTGSFSRSKIANTNFLGNFLWGQIDCAKTVQP